MGAQDLNKRASISIDSGRLCFCLIVNVNCERRFVIAMVYYGLSLNTFILSGNPYLNFLLMGLAEFPAYIIAQVNTNFIKHRLKVATAVLSIVVYSSNTSS